MALWRVDQTAEYLGIRPKTLYEWVRTGRVPFRKLGFNVRFDPEEIEAWVETQSAGDASDRDSGGASPGGELEALAREAAKQLRRVEADVGTELSYPQRQAIRDLAQRLDIAAGEAE